MLPNIKKSSVKVFSIISLGLSSSAYAHLGHTSHFHTHMAEYSVLAVVLVVGATLMRKKREGFRLFKSRR